MRTFIKPQFNFLLIELKFQINLKTLFVSLLVFTLFVVITTAVDYSFSSVAPVNLTSLNTSWAFFNMSINSSASSPNMFCNMTFGSANGTSYYNISMYNDTTTHYYRNLSVAWLADTGYGQLHNFTFVCNDSDPSAGSGGGNLSTSAQYQFKIDTINPTIGSAFGPFWNYTQLNTSTNGYLNITFNITDVNINACRVRINQENGAFTVKEGVLTPAATTRNCTVLVSSTDITQDGDFSIETWGNDTSQRSAYGTNQTGLASILVADKWNLVTYSGHAEDVNAAATGTDSFSNESLSDILNRLPGCTHISLFNTSFGAKNYITYARTAQLINNDTQVILGNATWIYCTSANTYLRPNYMTNIGMIDDTKITLYVNSSTTDTSWNLYGQFYDRNANETLYSDYTSNPEGDLSTVAGLAAGNITAMSFYNATLGQYVSCVKRNMTHIAAPLPICTHGYNATTWTIPKSFPVWVYVIANFTINRTAAVR